MRILIAGAKRSGTTALFNLTRLICEAHGATYAVFEDQYNEAVGETHDFEIVKIHKFRHEWLNWSDRIITILREPEDVWQSMCRFFADDPEELRREYGRNLTWLAMWNYWSDYEAHYNQLTRSTEKLARKIGEALGLDVAEKEIVRGFRKIKPPRKGVDPVTLLHANHITKR